MSLVTNVIVHFSIGEPFDVKSEIHAELSSGALKPITDVAGGESWGGTKYPEITLSAAAFNYLDWYEFRDHFESIPWTRPEVVQVLVAPQDFVTLGLFEIRGGRLVPTTIDAALMAECIGDEPFTNGKVAHVVGRGFPRSSAERDALVSRVSTRLGRDIADVRQRADLVFDFGDRSAEAG